MLETTPTISQFDPATPHASVLTDKYDFATRRDLIQQPIRDQLLLREQDLVCEESGYVYSPGAASRFPKSHVDGLLNAWLNLFNDGLLQGEYFVRDVSQIDNRVSLRVPTFNGDRVEYIVETFHMEPLFFPLMHRDQHEFSFKWPPDGEPPTVSPDAEAYNFYERQPPTGLSRHLRWLWPDPLRLLVPKGKGLDLLYHQALMCQIMQESNNDSSKALTKAQSLVAPYIQRGWSTRAHSWYWPTYFSWLQKGGEDHHKAVRQSRNLETPEDVFFLDEMHKGLKWDFSLGQMGYDDMSINYEDTYRTNEYTNKLSQDSLSLSDIDVTFTVIDTISDGIRLQAHRLPGIFMAIEFLKNDSGDFLLEKEDAFEIMSLFADVDQETMEGIYRQGAFE